ncbi:MAG: isocitrate lyase/PEP mutase family protein [Oscillibacter sp.]|nr:isocitrate lyase/PEP mutase family protein [Oscillibacter sp.]
MKKTTQLKQLLLSRDALPCPGVYDALSARVVEACGFQACQISGFGISASSLGMTDASFTSLEEVVRITSNIVRAVSIPVMTDADTGYGNAVNVWWTTKRLEETGAAGMNLEDQCLPKRCGHMEGKQLIALEEMVGKIKAAVDVREDPDFVINARTDAASVCGIDEAIRRGNAYLDAGADMVFVESPASVDEIKKAIQEIHGPVSINMLEGGRTPRLTFEELRELGAARVSCPMLTSLISAYALKRGLTYLKEHGTSVGFEELMPFETFKEFTDTSLVRAMEKKYIEEALRLLD